MMIPRFPVLGIRGAILLWCVMLALVAAVKIGVVIALWKYILS